jgi:hypothetical protein
MTIHVVPVVVVVGPHSSRSTDCICNGRLEMIPCNDNNATVVDPSSSSSSSGLCCCRSCKACNIRSRSSTIHTTVGIVVAFVVVVEREGGHRCDDRDAVAAAAADDDNNSIDPACSIVGMNMV